MADEQWLSDWYVGAWLFIVPAASGFGRGGESESGPVARRGKEVKGNERG